MRVIDANQRAWWLAGVNTVAGLDRHRMALPTGGVLDISAANAVRKFQATRTAGRPFDIVLMDLTVPGGMGGREVLDHLK